MELLKFITAGSVDDGKSTLIGRLLFDSDALLEDQLEAIKSANRKNDDGTIDLAIITDGLKAEREQGITIDVAYKYFNTANRKFIIIDAPGHVQYTRNMFTGASNADLAVVLIDARKGVIEQTKRHSFLCSLLGIKHIVVAVNKMDLVDFNEQIFEQIKATYLSFATHLNPTQFYFIPISALRGDNIVLPSEKIGWYKGPSLLQLLESVELNLQADGQKSYFAVQHIIRPQTTELHDYRGIAGKMLNGRLSVGDEVQVWPSGFATAITKIETFDGPIVSAHIGQAVTLHLKDQVDISRGDALTLKIEPPQLNNEVQVQLCWLDTSPLQPGRKYLLRQHSRSVRAVIRAISTKIDIHTLEWTDSDGGLQLNDIAKATIKLAGDLAFYPYSVNKGSGSFILVDEQTNLTVAAGIIE